MPKIKCDLKRRILAAAAVAAVTAVGVPAGAAEAATASNLSAVIACFTSGPEGAPRGIYNGPVHLQTYSDHGWTFISTTTPDKHGCTTWYVTFDQHVRVLVDHTFQGCRFSALTNSLFINEPDKVFSFGHVFVKPKDVSGNCAVASS